MVSSTVYVLFLIPCLFAIGNDLRQRWPVRLAERHVRPATMGERL